MIKKKVIVQGSLQSLSEFFSSPFNKEFEPLAILTNEPEKINQSIRVMKGTQPEIFTLDTLPRFALKFIDGIVLTDNQSRAELINRLTQFGIEPHKIILWNNRGVIEFFIFIYGGLAVPYSQRRRFKLFQSTARFTSKATSNVCFKTFTVPRFYFSTISREIWKAA